MEEAKELGTLIVVVGKARNLPNKTRFGKQNPFCSVSLGEDKQKTRAVKRGGQHPEWDEELRFTIMEDLEDVLARSESQSLADSVASSTASISSLAKGGSPGGTTAQALATRSRKGPLNKKGGKSMRVACYADDAKEPELIGECVVHIEEVLKKGEVDEWYECLYKDKYSGEIYLELTFYSNNAPPVKRNVPRPSIHSHESASGSSTSSTATKRPGIPSSGSASGLSLYIPPYAKPAAGTVENTVPSGSTPAAPAQANSVPSHGYGSQPASRAGIFCWRTTCAPGPSLTPQPPHSFSIDVLNRPLSALSMGPSQSRPSLPSAPSQPSQYASQSLGGHRHSLEAPWGALLPPAQPGTAPHPRPLSTNDALLSLDHIQRIEEERRLAGATPVARPTSAYHQPSYLSQSLGSHRQSSPIPSSLLAAGPLSVKQHANSFSHYGGASSTQPYLHSNGAVDPVPHPSSAPPGASNSAHVSQPAAYFSGIVRALSDPTQPPIPETNHGQQQQQQVAVQATDPYQTPTQAYFATPPRVAQDYSSQSNYATPPRQNSYSQTAPSPHQASPLRESNYGQPQRQAQGYNSEPNNTPSYGYQPVDESAPLPNPNPTPSTPKTTSSGAYVPWYQQTQSAAQGQQSQSQPAQLPSQPPQPYFLQPSQPRYTSALPPPIPSQRPVSQPPSSRPSMGYYPSDELYVMLQQPQQQPQHPDYQQPQQEQPQQLMQQGYQQHPQHQQQLMQPSYAQQQPPPQSGYQHPPQEYQQQQPPPPQQQQQDYRHTQQQPQQTAQRTGYQQEPPPQQAYHSQAQWQQPSQHLSQQPQSQQPSVQQRQPSPQASQPSPSSSWSQAPPGAYPVSPQTSQPHSQNSYPSVSQLESAFSSTPGVPHQQSPRPFASSPGPPAQGAPPGWQSTIAHPDTPQRYSHTPSPAPPPQQYYTPPSQPYQSQPSSQSYQNEPPRQASQPPTRVTTPLPPPGRPQSQLSQSRYGAPNRSPPLPQREATSAAPSPSPAPSARQDWKSYMQGLAVGGPSNGTGTNHSTPTASSPTSAPPPQQWYTPPSGLPTSIKPPVGWKSTLPAQASGHNWTG